MKIVRLTESDLTRIVRLVIKEQFKEKFVNRTKMSELGKQAVAKNDKFPKELSDIILNNKKLFGLSVNSSITPEYTERVYKELSKKKISNSDRNLLGVAINFIPLYETYLDVESIIKGLLNGDKSQFNTGVLGLSSPFLGKALINAWDYLSDLLIGKEQTDYNIEKRNSLINMSNQERIELFKRYGHGGYDKWVKDGKPKL